MILGLLEEVIYWIFLVNKKVFDILFENIDFFFNSLVYKYIYGIYVVCMLDYRNKIVSYLLFCCDFLIIEDNNWY